jgi:two-component system response regulator MprA
MTYKILVVEDDTNIREYLVDAFKEAGYSVKQTADGAEALKMVKDSPPDLIVLDLGIESISGETVCEEVKKMHPDLPIIILTAKNTSTEVVHGFDLGADDYISKPFETDELLARIRTRLKQKGTSTLEIDDLVVDTSSYEVKRGGKTISLTAKEFKLLEYLILNKGAVLSRETILDHIWLYSPEIESRVVDVYIGYLRKKIDEGHTNKLIKSVRGFGYTIRA